MTPQEGAMLAHGASIFAVLPAEKNRVRAVNARVEGRPLVFGDAVLVTLVLGDGQRRTLLAERLHKTAAKAVQSAQRSAVRVD